MGYDIIFNHIIKRSVRMQAEKIKEYYEKIAANLSKVIIGRDDTIKFLITALFAEGNVLLEDVPGSGKTTLAKALAVSVDGEFARIQMTPDLLPADITGINYYNPKTMEFNFVKGPAFSNILLADEINRATPKTQSGLLECMEEKQITIEGNTCKLNRPFMVIATQNPIDNQGVFPLPEAQMDRFLMKLTMDRVSHEAGMQILKLYAAGETYPSLKACVSKEEIIDIQDSVNNIKVHDDILNYALNLTEATALHEKILLGASTRGALGLVKAAKAYAATNGRDYCLPDDIKAVFKPVIAHRLILKSTERLKGGLAETVIDEILANTVVPTEEL